MNVLAASMDIGLHPAFALLLGGLVAVAVLRGHFASMALVIAPPLGFWQVYSSGCGHGFEHVSIWL